MITFIFSLVLAAQAHASPCANYLVPSHSALQELADFLALDAKKHANGGPDQVILNGSVTWRAKSDQSPTPNEATSPNAQLMIIMSPSSNLSLRGLDFIIDTTQSFGRLRNFTFGASNQINGTASIHQSAIQAHIDSLEARIQLTDGQKALIEEWQDWLEDEVTIFRGPDSMTVMKYFRRGGEISVTFDTDPQSKKIVRAHATIEVEHEFHSLEFTFP